MESSIQYSTMQEDFKKLDLSVDGGENTQKSRIIVSGKKRQRKEVTNDEPGCNKQFASELESETNQKLEPKQTNRRFLLRPRKRVLVNTKSNECDLVNLYNVENKRPKLDNTNKFKLKHTNLETIFEEPVKKKNGSLKLIGATRVNRTITFPDFITKTKQKKRKAQIKKLKSKNAKLKCFKYSLIEVQTKLNEIISEDVV